MPLVVAAALAIGAVSGGFGGGKAKPSPGPAGAVTVPEPPNAVAQTTNCTKVLVKLPTALGKLNPRVVHTTGGDNPAVVAWGDPAIVLSCGVAKPKQLYPGSGEHLQSGGDLAGPYYIVTGSAAGNVWTSVDRAPYISVTIPSKYQGGTYMPPLSRAIASALPAVCSTDSGTPDPDKLCTRRTT